MKDRFQQLVSRGVTLLCPESITIAENVKLEQISSDVVIHPGCRILGSKTSVGPGCVLGAEAPLTLDNCRLGVGVELKGGFCSGSVFLSKSSAGSSAHIRPGCLFEEEASCAHSVGLKQTVLMSFVTAGSLINFCDVLMSGGRSRRDHSEIGSSYIHFNFTPHGDKATASLVGDVPQGVLLNSNPIFLGGQGGLVGPARIAYGCVVAAGTIFRGDALLENHICGCDTPFSGQKKYDLRLYKKVNRLIHNNLIYIGNINALRAWYKNVRRPVMVKDRFDGRCYEGAVEVLELILKERVSRLSQLSEKLSESVRLLMEQNGREEFIEEQEAFVSHWPILREQLDQSLDVETDAPAIVFDELSGATSGNFTECVQNMSSKAQVAVSGWLQGLVDQMACLYS